MAEEQKSTFSNFISKIESKITDLTTLNIKTVVGDYDFHADNTITPQEGGEFKVISSDMSLIDGDVTTHISNDLVQDKYAWVRDFHARKEEKGHEIVQGNIQAIISLFELYRGTKRVKFNDQDMDDTEEEFEPLAGE